ncbi:MAG TPA: ATP-grasp domain-containing protein [Xenococcaceae cyanobacterium]|jgi:succinyl-CoA synthetase beta subunit
MDLLEYQAKTLFNQIGIPVLPSQTIKEPRELKQLQIPYPVVLKSQVKAGGRGKAGGIKFVSNTIDAIAAARNIFNLAILEEYPQVILAEAQYDVQEEFFLAVVLDYHLKLPVLLGSAQGGMNVPRLLDNLQQVVVATEFSPFYARRLVVKMGLSGELIESVSEIIVKMYRIFQDTDLDFVEINPLGVNAQGKLMALDGKIKIDDFGLTRHPEIYALPALKNLSPGSPEPTSNRDHSQLQWLNWQDETGKIAIVANHLDLVTLCWDLLRQQKEKPAYGVVIPWEMPAENWDLQLREALAQLQNIKRLKVIMINIWADSATNQKIAEKIRDYYHSNPQKTSKQGENERSLVANGALFPSQRQSKAKSDDNLSVSLRTKLVVRLAEAKIAAFSQKSDSELLHWTNNLTDAVDRAIAIAKSK